MTLLVNSRVRIIPDKITYVRRQHQGSGKILVNVGQEVLPSDVIGRSTVSTGFRSINLAEALSVSPSDVKKYLQRELGKPIFKGELLAYKKGGLFGGKRIVTSPTDGILELLNEKTGVIKLQILPQQIDLPAAVFGVVAKVDHIKKEVIIKTQATEVYGVLGSGKTREGYLKVLGGRGDLIGKETISAELTDKILVGGGIIYTQALNKAVSLGINGIITGGINSEDFKSMSGGRLKRNSQMEADVGIGMVVTEGFGIVPIGQDIFNLLVGFDDRFVILEGNKKRLSLPSFDAGCLAKVKQVELPTQAKIEEVAVEAKELKIGQSVRVIGNTYMGEIGKVASIDQSPSRLPSGIFVVMVTLETPSRKIKVPYTNIEVISE